MLNFGGRLRRGISVTLVLCHIMFVGLIVNLSFIVVPAQAGIQYSVLGITGCAGMTNPWSQH